MGHSHTLGAMGTKPFRSLNYNLINGTLAFVWRIARGVTFISFPPVKKQSWSFLMQQVSKNSFNFFPYQFLKLGFIQTWYKILKSQKGVKLKVPGPSPQPPSSHPQNEQLFPVFLSTLAKNIYRWAQLYTCIDLFHPTESGILYTVPHLALFI